MFKICQKSSKKILSGQNIEELMQKDDEDYTEEPLNNLEKKNITLNISSPSSTQQENKDAINITSEESSINIQNKQENELKNKIEETIDEKEKKKKKIKKEEPKKEQEVFPQFKNPLDFVKYLEIDRVDRNILNEMQNFLLENHRKKHNKYEVIEINSLLQINNEIEEIDINLMLVKRLSFILYKKWKFIIIFFKSSKFHKINNSKKYKKYLYKLL